MEQRFLGEILHRRAGIPLDRLEAMYAIQREKGIALTDLLVNGNVVDDVTIAKALAAEAELPYAERVDPEKISTALATRLPINFAKTHAGKMIVSGEDDATVFVMVADPFDVSALDEVRLLFEKNVDVSVATSDAIENAINRVYDREAGGGELENDESRVDEHEVAIGEGAAVVDVVEDRRVLARADDRRVAGTLAAAPAERVVDQRLELVLEHARPARAHRRDVGLGRDVGGLLERRELLGPLVEAQLVERIARIDHGARRALAALLDLAHAPEQPLDGQQVDLRVLLRVRDGKPTVARAEVELDGIIVPENLPPVEAAADVGDDEAMRKRVHNVTAR